EIGIMADYLGDCFYDCQSATESDDEESAIDLEPINCEQVVRAVGGYSPNFEDPLEMRHTIERVAINSRMLLRSVGGNCECLGGYVDRSASASFFYPATLEICARLLTDKSCACPPSCQCRLRGEPVILQLPMELNPYSGQVNVEIFQHAPKALASARGCHCIG
ncbi:hypothetical protein KR093_011639, partial [Drosophila rubida]